MQTVLLTDDQGYYPIAVFPTHTGSVFVDAPMAVVITDANGYNGGVFVSAPRAMKQVTNRAGTFGTETIAPIAAVETDRKGVSLWSGAFIAAPTAIVLV